MSDAYKREDRERERIGRTGKFLREEFQRSGSAPLTQDQAEAMVRDARERGRKKRGES